MASYRGADNANLVAILKNFPYSLRQCYLESVSFFYDKKTFSDLEFIEIVLAGLFLVYLFTIVLQFFRLFKRSRVHAIFFIIGIVLLPAASCFVLIIAVGNTMSLLMSMGLIVSIVFLGIIVPKDGKIGFLLKRMYIIFLTAFLWYQLSAVENDQLALKEGKTATVTLAENIMGQLYSKGYLNEYQTVAFIGRPANNDSFAQSTAYQMANDYAKFGCWSTDARNNRVSWNGVISNFLGINLNLCGESEYQELILLEEVTEMPEFPLDGSICIINDIIVIKVSDLF